MHYKVALVFLLGITAISAHVINQFNYPTYDSKARRDLRLPLGIVEPSHHLLPPSADYAGAQLRSNKDINRVQPVTMELRPKLGEVPTSSLAENEFGNSTSSIDVEDSKNSESAKRKEALDTLHSSMIIGNIDSVKEFVNILQKIIEEDMAKYKKRIENLDSFEEDMHKEDSDEEQEVEEDDEVVEKEDEDIEKVSADLPNMDDIRRMTMEVNSQFEALNRGYFIH